MKLKNYYILPIFLLFIVPFRVYANTTIDIKATGENVKTDVTVKNNTNGSNSDTTTESNTNTKIRIETNGEVKTYESDKPGSINIKSDNGITNVNINENTHSGNSTIKNSTQSSNFVNTTEIYDPKNSFRNTWKNNIGNTYLEWLRLKNHIIIQIRKVYQKYWGK